MYPNRQRSADAYRNLLVRIRQECCGCAEEEPPPPLPGELEVQALWHAGLLGNEGETMRHGRVRILDFGEWNRSVGPDFLRAEIEINGARMRGDIEIDPTARDWEEHGHGANPNFTNVVLHVVLQQPPAGWYTRNAQHLDIPILPIKPEQIRSAMGAGVPLHRESAGLCRQPLDNMSVADIEKLLQAAAAYRAGNKRKLFCCKAEVMGESQAWFEAMAETLGYKINKLPMQLLARRAPLRKIRSDAESILAGTAGFLLPVLPEKADSEARLYHRRVWDAWWPRQEEFALSHSRSLPWQYAPIRPANHPQRRVAALALIATHWRAIEPHLNAAGAKRLTQALTSLHHPFWSHRWTLSAPPMKSEVALIGSERVKDFLANHLYVQDESHPAWQTYLQLKNNSIPHRVQLTAGYLFGQREDVQPLLKHLYVQQALLQIDADFCVRHSCDTCLFPEQLCCWRSM